MRGCGSIRRGANAPLLYRAARYYVLLEECQQDEEAHPERSHGMPIPGDTVDQDLTVLDCAEEVEAGQRSDEAKNSEDKVEGVRPGDDVERVAADVGVEEYALEAKLVPGKHLAGKKK